MRLETYCSTVKVLMVRMKAFSALLLLISGFVSYFSILGSSGSRGREVRSLSYSVGELTRGVWRVCLDLSRFFTLFLGFTGLFSVFFAVNFSIFAFPRSAFSLI